MPSLTQNVIAVPVTRPVIGLTVSLACAAGVAAILGYWPMRLSGEGWIDYMADDAFYYFIIAKNLATHGLSTFDGTTLTNGYQPLWQMLLALQYALMPGSFAPTVYLEWASLALAALLMFRLVEPDDYWCLPLFAAFLVGLVDYPLVLGGMEPAILFLTFAVFALALRSTARSGAAPWQPMAISAGLVIAARLDAALFIVPSLLLVPVARVQKVRALVLIGVCGVLYIVANRLVFGAWVPVSGTIKSLGGGKINWVLLHQLVEQTGSESMARRVLTALRSLVGRTISLSVITATLMLISDRRDSFAWRLALATQIGFALFVARLVFFSSWRIWEWYAFPIFFFLLVDFLLLAAILRSPASGRPFTRVVATLVVGATVLISSIFTWREVVTAGIVMSAAWWLPLPGRKATTAILGLGLLLAVASSVVKVPPLPNRTVGIFSRPLAEEVRAVIGQAPVAMGDRAGAFAYFYGGSVSQLEGLVNDEQYLRYIEARQPVDRLLCDRGVRYLVAYEEDLGNYESHVVHTLRPILAGFAGPTLTVTRADEVAKITDAEKYGVRENDRTVYVWRLPNCEKTGR